MTKWWDSDYDSSVQLKRGANTGRSLLTRSCYRTNHTTCSGFFDPLHTDKPCQCKCHAEYVFPRRLQCTLPPSHDGSCSLEERILTPMERPA